MKILEPLVEKMNPNALMRIKANPYHLLTLPVRD